MSQSNLEMISSNLHPPHSLGHHRVMDTSLSRNLVRAEVKHLISAQDFQVWGLLIVEAILRLEHGPWVHCPEQLRLSAQLIVYIDNLQSYTFGWTRERCQKLRNHQNYPRISADILFLDNALMDV